MPQRMAAVSFGVCAIVIQANESEHARISQGKLGETEAGK